ncbi:MAG TPA: dTMP kinase [Pseudonocardia sp.]|nr:dTMP kinase [Pseudonocardia sp.]
MPTGGSGPTAHRVRAVLGIPSFRRLWVVTAVASTGDWLSLLALSALATQLTHGTQAQSFALGGVVATRLLPALILGPIAGVLADRFDRRKVMVTCDLLRFVLFFSIPLVGSLPWLFAATFLIEICSMFWIPAKDASIPNLLKRPDQIETANQLSLAMTYGVAVVTASGLFTAVSTVGRLVGNVPSPTTTVYLALMINGAGYLLTAGTVWLRIPEISGRSPGRTRENSQGSLMTLLRDGARFVGTTPLVRGLVIGILGAFAAGGAVIALAKLYATSLGGGDAAYGMLFVSVFIGMATGMSAMPGLARKLPYNRLFGVAIVTAGASLVLVAVAPHLFFALGAVALVGFCAGVAFLTGLTIIGAEVANEVRGRVVAFVQSIVRLDLLASMSLVPVAVGLVQTRTFSLFGHPYVVDGTRMVLGVAGLIAAGVGVLAHRQMDDRRTEPLLGGLLGALRRRRPVGGVLIAVEGATAAESADQSRRLVDWLRAEGYAVTWSAEDSRLDLVVEEFTGGRARALAGAARYAEVVEREVRPALATGGVVIVDRFLASPLGHAGFLTDELEHLAVLATGGLRPDVTVLLDRAPSEGTMERLAIGEEHLRVHQLLTRRAATEPDRYLVVDADLPPDLVAARVVEGVRPLLRAVRRTTQ